MLIATETEQEVLRYNPTEELRHIYFNGVMVIQQQQQVDAKYMAHHFCGALFCEHQRTSQKQCGSFLYLPALIWSLMHAIMPCNAEEFPFFPLLHSAGHPKTKSICT